MQHHRRFPKTCLRRVIPAPPCYTRRRVHCALMRHPRLPGTVRLLEVPRFQSTPVCRPTCATEIRAECCEYLLRLASYRQITWLCVCTKDSTVGISTIFCPRNVSNHRTTIGGRIFNENTITEWMDALCFDPLRCYKGIPSCISWNRRGKRRWTEGGKKKWK